MNHTPGPWKVGKEEPFVYALNDAGTNRFFAGINTGWLTEGGTNKPDDQRTSHEEVMANARLIAAAPDLLEALEMCLEAMEMQEGRESGIFHIPSHTARAIWDERKKEARAALKKARG